MLVFILDSEKRKKIVMESTSPVVDISDVECLQAKNDRSIILTNLMLVTSLLSVSQAFFTKELSCGAGNSPLAFEATRNKDLDFRPKGFLSLHS